MNGRRVISILLAVAGVSISPAGATGGGTAGLAGTTVERLDARASAVADPLREAAASGSLSSLIRAVHAVRGIELTVAPSAGGPASVRDAVGRLDTVVSEVATSMGRLSSGDVARGSAALVRASLRNRAAQPVSFPGSIVRAAKFAPIAQERIAAVLDWALPILREGSAPRTGLAATGCDLVDELPNLCVGSEADNTFTEHASLLIDLGGNDTYRNSAGGAPFTSPDDDYITVSVNVDLGGNDGYEATGAMSGMPPHFVLAQGGSILGGVGIAIDVGAGADRYHAVAPAEDPTQLFAIGGAVAQGGGKFGQGLLVDDGGSDSYAIVGPEDPSVGRMVTGQGGALICGWDFSAPFAGCPNGILVDEGTGDDSYVLDAGRVDTEGRAEAQGQGSASTGLGLLFDGGGNDRLRAHLELRSDRSVPKPYSPGFVTDGLRGLIDAQGSGSSGIGVVLEGSGTTTYEMSTEGHGAFNFAQVVGQGRGSGGTGVLQDRGGDDRYVITGSAEAVRTDVGGPDCGCASVSVQPGSISIDAQGASLTGFGALQDASGNDLYEIDVRHSARSVLVSNGQAGPPEYALTGHQGTTVWGQGSGVLGDAILHDAAGTDAYRISIDNETVVSTNDQSVPVRATTVKGGNFIVQGAGASYGSGVLIDDAGTGDEVQSLLSSSTRTVPEGGEVFDPAWLSWDGYWGQGSNGGVLITAGTSPRILMSPAVPTLIGTNRGFGQWISTCSACGNDPEAQWLGTCPCIPFSFGSAPLSTGAAPALEFTASPSTPVPDDGKAHAEIRLRTPSGAPLAGRVVHLMFQTYYRGTVDTNSYWSAVWQVDVTTGADGTASGDVPVALPDYWIDLDGFRIVATFDGEDGLYPRFATRTFQREL